MLNWSTRAIKTAGFSIIILLSNNLSIYLIPFKKLLKTSYPNTNDIGKPPTADATENLPPIEDHIGKDFYIPYCNTFSLLAEMPKKCL